VKKYFLPLLCFLLSACNSDNEVKQVPAGLLSKEKMVSIMIDVHIEESKLMQQNYTPDSGQIAFRNRKEEILKKNGVSQEDFQKSYQYYLENITEMDAIYAVVIDSLSLRESKGVLN
jgi:hypothetical protein